jgi:LacI family transcriptional regulator
VGREEIQGRVKLADVAAAAGVHTATASRALSPDPNVARTVNPATRGLVLETARSLGYRPNLRGRALRTGRSLVLGLLVPRISDTVLSSFYEGMLAESERAGYTVVVANTGDRPARRQQQVEQLIERGVDGIIYTDAHLGEPVPEARDVPVVQAFRYSQPPGGVTADDRTGGAEVARHLQESGHERFALLAGLTHASSTVNRTTGFLDALERSGVDITAQVRVTHSGLSTAEGREITEELMSRSDRPTAIFAVDDHLALGAMSAVQRGGLVPGRDVAVVGYSDLPLARELPIPLSSVAVSLDQLGARAVRSLLGVVSGQPPLSEHIVPELRIRQSSAQ